MDFKAIQILTADDMAKVNKTIQTQLSSDVTLIKKIGLYVLNSGGKRLRPLLVILSTRALGYQGDAHTTSAAFIEFIHTATLLHDDVIDKSDTRRGKATVNTAFGNAASVLVGDFIYTRSFQMMTKLGSLRILELMSNVVNIIAEGEIQQLMHCNDPNTTEENYMKVIYSKTARLFEAAMQIGAILNNSPAEIEIALRNYGKHLGIAFQLTDDVIDCVDDLSEGKPTLPLLHTIRNSPPEKASLIREVIVEKTNGPDKLKEILTTIKQTGSLKYAKKKALIEVDKAIASLSVLPESEHKQALVMLAYAAVNQSSR
ncbi:octaprenyl-diphosphate synthase [Candidatus Photodesmus blepharus]|uniref:Octaprenyl diphosphate synthase n=1 Tax=Candidatus Photodesmus blepharonis TaxID=1179155 RepID=A0A084CM22_9GAMM|nr:octaprenyl diphosphate synthase [Candidatus Photodesmus blepharus]KEY90851.1 octaprenyl-diphosphate synthase [Candidatus Photodesmus blepharus]